MSDVPSASTPRGKRNGGPINPADTVGNVFAQKAKAIAETVAMAATGGDTQAARLVLDRVAPAPRERAVRFELPPINSAADLPKAVAALIAATAAGQISPGEANQLAGVLEHYRKQAETADLAARIEALETSHARKP